MIPKLNPCDEVDDDAAGWEDEDRLGAPPNEKIPDGAEVGCCGSFRPPKVKRPPLPVDPPEVAGCCWSVFCPAKLNVEAVVCGFLFSTLPKVKADACCC